MTFRDPLQDVSHARRENKNLRNQNHPDNTAMAARDTEECIKPSPMLGLPRTIFHYTLSPFVPTTIVVPNGAKLLGVTTVDGQIRAYVEQADTRAVHFTVLAELANNLQAHYDMIEFRVFRAGMRIPQGFHYVGYAALRDGRCRNHVYWARRPLDA